MRRRRPLRAHARAAAFCAAFLVPLAASAVDAVTGASRPSLPAGTPDAGIWITGVGFDAAARVEISGDGIRPTDPHVVVPQAQRADGGRGDGIRFYFAIDAAASPGRRDITVVGGDGTRATGRGLFEVLPAAGPAPEPEPEPGADAGAAPPPDPPRGSRVDVVSKASPTYGAQGDQVNVWIVGRTFAPGATVTFSRPGLGPALVDGEPLPPKIVRNAESEQGKSDGIEYYLRIAPETELGPVDVTVTNPDGSSSTGPRIFEVVEPGTVPEPPAGAGNVDGVTGASPRAFRAGRTLSLWIWGKGFEPGAELAFSVPGIVPYAAPEVVRDAASNRGYSGVRAFLTVARDVPAGPLDVTVMNPNRSAATGVGLLTVVGAAAPPGVPPGPDAPPPGPGDVVDERGGCDAAPASGVVLEEITRVFPSEVERGAPFPLAIIGRGFACGASVVVSGGGLRVRNEASPRLVRSPLDPALTTLYWDLEVAPEAPLGPRDVTVVNPDNSSKTLQAAFSVVAPGGDERARSSGGGVAACAAVPGAPSGAAPALLMLAGLLLLGRRRPARACPPARR